LNFTFQHIQGEPILLKIIERLKKPSVLLTFVLISACGGGGNSEPGTSSALSSEQTAFIKAFGKTSAGGSGAWKWDWYQSSSPTTNSSTTFDTFIGIDLGLDQSPIDAPVVVSLKRTAMKGPPLTDASNPPDWIALGNGQILKIGTSTKYSYNASAIFSESMSSDNTAVRCKLKIHDIVTTSAPATFAALPAELKDRLPIRSYLTNGISPTATFVAGSAFTSYKTTYVEPCYGILSDYYSPNGPLPVGDPSITTIESLFALPNGTQSQIDSGTISMYEGTRVWVANNPKTSNTLGNLIRYVFYAEVDGRVYRGLMVKANTTDIELFLIDNQNIVSSPVMWLMNDAFKQSVANAL
jgi:hypothetical protein